MNREELLEQQIEKLTAERDLLLEIIGGLPGHLYWLDESGVYLGCNDQEARDIGLKTRGDIIGLTNHDLFPKEEADALDRINEEVLRTRKVYKGEEISSYKDGVTVYLTQKSPMSDAKGNLIGILGISIDITEKKRAERLSIENSLQELRLKTSENFCNFIRKATHDLMSPLCILENTINMCAELSENHLKTMQNVVDDIKGIAGILSMKFQDEESETYAAMMQPLLVHLMLNDILDKKRSEYRSIAVNFTYDFDEGVEFATIMGDPLNFGRMISNVINNAVESLKYRVGNVAIRLCKTENLTKISIKDNGCGMPKEMLRKIKGHVDVSTTKQNGNGLGLKQLYYTVEKYGGTVDVNSEEGQGTEFVLNFPNMELPRYITNRLTFHKGDTILVLDDATSMFAEWNDIFKKFGRDIDVKYFSEGEDALRFIEDFPEPEKLYLLSDFYLRSQSKNGLTIILESGLKKHCTLVTSFYNNKKVFDCAEEVGIQVLPKQLIHLASISVL